MFSKSIPFKWFKREEPEGYKLLTDNDLLDMVLNEDHTDPYLFLVKSVGTDKYAVVSRFQETGTYTPNQWNFVSPRSPNSADYVTYARNTKYIQDDLAETQVRALSRMKGYRTYIIKVLRGRINDRDIIKRIEEIKNEP